MQSCGVARQNRQPCGSKSGYQQYTLTTDIKTLLIYELRLPESHCKSDRWAYIPLQTQRAFECDPQTSTCQLSSKFGGVISSQQLKCLIPNRERFLRSLRADTVFHPGFWSATSKILLARKAVSPSSPSANANIVRDAKSSTRMRRKNGKLLEASSRRTCLGKSSTPNLQLTKTATMKTP